MAYVTDAPSAITITALTTPTASSGTWTLAFLTGQPLNMNRNNSGSNQNNYLEYEISLAAGTYTFDISHQKNSNCGIVTLAIDGTTVGTIDTYASSATYGNFSTVTGITIPTTGRQKLRLTIATKNASSSDYILNFNFFSLIRTGA